VITGKGQAGCIPDVHRRGPNRLADSRDVRAWRSRDRVHFPEVYTENIGVFEYLFEVAARIENVDVSSEAVYIRLVSGPNGCISGIRFSREYADGAGDVRSVEERVIDGSLRLRFRRFGACRPPGLRGARPCTQV
jgi:hypothetical protein